MAIRKRGQRWLCAEVVLRASLGYGQYCFELGSPVDRLDPNAVLGLFTWSDAPDFAHRELDIEFSRWGDAEALNAQFVVQPYTDPRNLVRFDLPEGLPVSTHGFQWQPDRVTFRSVRGSGGCTPAPDTVLEEHTFTWGIPQTGGENVRMNLWLFNHTAPTGEGDLEVIVKSFHFTPL